MYDAGEADKGVFKPKFNRSVMIDFKGAKIAAGYEDCNYADHLRIDPAIRLTA